MSDSNGSSIIELRKLNSKIHNSFENDYVKIISEQILQKSLDIYNKNNDFIEFDTYKFEDSSPNLLDCSQQIISDDISIDTLFIFITRKNIDNYLINIAKNILSPLFIINQNLGNENQRKFLQKYKSFQSYLKDIKILNNSKNKCDSDSISIFANSYDDLSQDIGNNGFLSSQMSFEQESYDKWVQIVDKQETTKTTHDLSKQFLEYVKNIGKKHYYNDVYSKFHKDDIIKTAYILDDIHLYDFLIHTGQMNQDELKKLPILGQNKTELTAHYDALMTPSFMTLFLIEQKLLSAKFHDDFFNIFKNKPWFCSGGLQTFIQIIGGEVITPDEVNYFLEWHKLHEDDFDKLFDFFDIQRDFSFERHSEQYNMRSKQMTADTVKAAFVTGLFSTLQSANDPLPLEFFEIDLSKKIEMGFYKGFTYRDYLLLRGFNIQDIENKSYILKPNVSMTQKPSNISMSLIEAIHRPII